MGGDPAEKAAVLGIGQEVGAGALQAGAMADAAVGHETVQPPVAHIAAFQDKPAQSYFPRVLTGPGLFV